MRVLGIDCGTERTGFGVVSSDGRTHQLVHHGVIRTSPRFGLEQRLKEIAAGLRECIELHRPEMAAVEEVLRACKRSINDRGRVPFPVSTLDKRERNCP